MLDGTAALYDQFYDALDKDYEWEAKRVLRLGRDVIGRRPRTLLDVACGTGRHLEVFGRTLDCAGIDNDAAMLAVASQRCPTVPLMRADMQYLPLLGRFDIVTCLFSSVAYVGTVPALRRTVRAMASNLTPGGVLVIEPWYEPDEWDVGHMAVLTIDSPELKAVRISRSSRRRQIAILDFDYLVADRHGTRHLSERHELRLFKWDEYLDAFVRAGLTVTTDDYGLFGRGLVLGRR